MVRGVCGVCLQEATISCAHCSKILCNVCDMEVHEDDEKRLHHRIPIAVMTVPPSGVVQSDRSAPAVAAIPAAQVPLSGGDTRVIHLNNNAANLPARFCDNTLRTAKYRWATFIPHNLFIQFSRLANDYFLIISCLQLFTDLSPTSKYTTAFPLALVVTFTMLREAYEDTKRHKADNEVNNRPFQVLRQGSNWEEVASKNIMVGDIVLLADKQEVPADVVLLSCSQLQGISYIDTQNLDGETNLKLRQCLDPTKEMMTVQDLSRVQGQLLCEQPNKDLYTFKGTLQTTSGPVPIGLDNTIWRGATLRNTKFAHGLVIYTGKVSKIMMNSLAKRNKMSNVERTVNTSLFLVLGLELVVCSLCTILMAVWVPKNRDAWYLPFLEDHGDAETAMGFVTFLILFNNFVPISLYVTMEFVKMIQAKLLSWDLAMYHEETDTPAAARTSNLNEELGQIQYIFSDKTGTLTRNEMEFRKCSINGQVYGTGTTEIGRAAAARRGEVVAEDGQGLDPRQAQIHHDPKLGFDDPRLIQAIQGQGTTAEATCHFMSLLAIAHTVVPEGDSQNVMAVEYQAESPDEAALVSAARSFGFAFVDKHASTVTVDALGERQFWEIKAINKFTSTRKRMSVVTRRVDAASNGRAVGPLMLLVKGADNVMMPLLSPDTAPAARVLQTQLDEFASEGLRTLVLASRAIDEPTWANWGQRFDAASTSLGDREEALAEVAALMEQDLALVGATAIEDKLQVGVPTAIATLAKGGIKIWVLTGDKEETAINIGFACQLLTDDMDMTVMSSGEATTIRAQLTEALRKSEGKDESALRLALVIDGRALTTVEADPGLRSLFLDFGIKCKAVIACRVSPKQKAEIVKLVAKEKRPAPMTLAIGDGANDVPMISEAHVGIGISGKEGMQAVRASDYAIAQFRFLTPLLLVHGRHNYRRIAIVILYSFYKNCALVSSLFFFCIYNGFSGTTLYNSIISASYNVIYTSIPIIAVGVLNTDLPSATILGAPELYFSGQQRREFNPVEMAKWLATGVVHACLVYFLPLIIIQDATDPDNGQPQDGLFVFGTTVANVLAIVVNVRLALEIFNWTLISGVVVIGSMLSFLILVFLASSTTFISDDLYYVGAKMYGSGPTWASIFLGAIAIGLVMDLSIKFIQVYFTPTASNIFVEAESLKRQPAPPVPVLQPPQPLPSPEMPPPVIPTMSINAGALDLTLPHGTRRHGDVELTRVP